MQDLRNTKQGALIRMAKLYSIMRIALLKESSVIKERVYEKKSEGTIRADRDNELQVGEGMATWFDGTLTTSVIIQRDTYIPP
jgi:hypothetical protein